MAAATVSMARTRMEAARRALIADLASTSTLGGAAAKTAVEIARSAKTNTSVNRARTITTSSMAGATVSAASTAQLVSAWQKQSNAPQVNLKNTTSALIVLKVAPPAVTGLTVICAQMDTCSPMASASKT